MIQFADNNRILTGLNPLRPIIDAMFYKYLGSKYLQQFVSFFTPFFPFLQESKDAMSKKTTHRKSWDSDPKPGEQEIDKAEVDAITRKRSFEYFDKPSIGNRFYIFKEKGDEITGTVIGGAIANIKRSSSWPIKLESGEIVEIFGNKLLHKKLKKCVHRKVRIVYIGREHNTWGGHATKIYRVHLIERDGETPVTIRKNKKKKRGEQ